MRVRKRDNKVYKFIVLFKKVFMKKFIIALAIASIGTVAANAQKVVATNPFWSNTFVQVGIDYSLANPTHVSDWTKEVFPNGTSFGLNVGVGKWFSPEIGLRLKVQWENGLIGSDHKNAPNYKGTGSVTQWVPNKDKGGYGAIMGDVFFNFSNIFCGYNESRVWNFIPYLGAGVIRSFDANTYNPALRAGIENSWKLGKRVNLFVDLDYTFTTGYVVSNRPYGTASFGHHDAANHHGFVQGQIGLQFNLGKTNWDAAISAAELAAVKAAYDAQIADLEAQIAKLRDENAQLRAEIAKLKAAKPAEDKGSNYDPTITGQKAKREVVASSTSIFFDKNSSEINSDADLYNIKNVADAAKANKTKVVVTGSADSSTGSAAYNQALSERRANSVVDELVNYGVNRSDIEVIAKGGISESENVALDRRVVIELK